MLRSTYKRNKEFCKCVLGRLKSVALKKAILGPSPSVEKVLEGVTKRKAMRKRRLNQRLSERQSERLSKRLTLRKS